MMYELLAHVYDALVKDDEATACWVELIKAHIRGTELLELACGSGGNYNRSCTGGLPR